MEINPIRTDEDHRAALAEIDVCWGAPEGTERGDRLDVLLALVDAYEEKRWPISIDENFDPVDVLNHAIEELGHSQADELSRDGVTRKIPLEERAAGERHWALALEAFRVAHGGDRGARILESPDDLQVGSEIIPAARSSNRADGRRPCRRTWRRSPTATR